MSGPGAQLRLLVICTANRYRSPLAEYLLKGAAHELKLRWRVLSAGTDAVDGLPMDRDVSRILLERLEPSTLTGLDGWRSRRLTRDHLFDAELVLCAAKEHRRAVVAVAPAAIRRSFLLRQFACLVAPGAAASGESLLRTATARRGRLLPGDAADIPDPVGGTLADLLAVADEIERAARTIALGAASLRWPSQDADG